MRFRTVSCLGFALFALCVGFSSPSLGAAPNPATGRWDRDDGLGGIAITPCGDALCGQVIWLRDAGGPAYIGQKVLFDMRPSGPNEWSGTAHNPEDGRDYAGTMTLAGDHMQTRGCIFGGLICKSVGLTRR